MLLEWLEHCLTPCPRPWRELGYLREQIAIDARLARNRGAWLPHQEATRALVLAAAERCARRDCAVLLGAGLAHDLPVAELCARFKRVVLADLVHRPLPRRRAHAAGALCAEWDATGVLREVYQHGAALDDEPLLSCVRTAAPGLPSECAGAEPDLIVSASLASQLMLLPLEWLEARRPPRSEEMDTAFAARLCAAAAEAHRRWLEARTGVRVLVTEQARVRVPATPGEGSRESTPPLGACAGPGEPTARWTWRLAPAPEVSRTHHIEHEMAGWIW